MLLRLGLYKMENKIGIDLQAFFACMEQAFSLIHSTSTAGSRLNGIVVRYKALLFGIPQTTLHSVADNEMGRGLL